MLSSETSAIVKVANFDASRDGVAEKLALIINMNHKRSIKIIVC